MMAENEKNLCSSRILSKAQQSTKNEVITILEFQCFLFLISFTDQMTKDLSFMPRLSHAAQIKKSKIIRHADCWVVQKNNWDWNPENAVQPKKVWKLKQNNLVLLKDELENPQLDLFRHEVNHFEMDVSGDVLDTAVVSLDVVN